MLYQNVSEVRAALRGPNGSIRTPFHADGSIDFQGLARIIDTHLAVGNTTILLTAGDSHFQCLGDEEIAEVTRAAGKQVGRRAMLVAADRYHATDRAVAFARLARDAGAHVLMTMPPDWGKSVTVESLLEHYAAVSRILPVMVVTNIFIPRGAEFGLEVMRRVVESVPGVVAVKDDFCGDFAREMARIVHPRIAVYSGGLKTNHFNIHPHGCDGYLSSMVTFKPAVARSYWDAIERNDLDSAGRIIRDTEKPWIDYLMTLPGGFDAGMHGMLELYGLAQRWRRKPYHSLTEAQMEGLTDKLRVLSLL